MYELWCQSRNLNKLKRRSQNITATKKHTHKNKQKQCTCLVEGIDLDELLCCRWCCFYSAYTSQCHATHCNVGALLCRISGVISVNSIHRCNIFHIRIGKHQISYCYRLMDSLIIEIRYKFQLENANISKFCIGLVILTRFVRNLWSFLLFVWLNNKRNLFSQNVLDKWIDGFDPAF